MKLQHNCASIKAIYTSLPKQIRSLDEDVDVIYNGDINKLNRIKKSIGLNKRHIADQDTTTLDLCTHSIQCMFHDNIIESSSIDAIIFVTQTPDYMQPNNSHILHHRLNLNDNCACFDINMGCSGYVYGLFIGFCLVNSGCNNILLLAGDTISKIVNPIDSNTAPIFGDAGSATLISKSHSTSYFSLHSDGSGFNHLIYPNSGFRLDNRDRFLEMNGAEVFNFSIDKEPKAIKEILEFANKNIDSIDYIFFHQANAYIISNIARRLNISLDKAPSSSVSMYGNTSSASIPLAICHQLHKGIDSNLEIILSGFGVGLSWATCLIQIQKDIYISKPLIYKGENI